MVAIENRSSTITIVRRSVGDCQMAGRPSAGGNRCEDPEPLGKRVWIEEADDHITHHRYRECGCGVMKIGNWEWIRKTVGDTF